MSGETLRRIDDAVARLVSGAYGYYSECGCEIFQSASKRGFRRRNVMKCPGANS
jgi:RNA polymerase-binding transcription factor DksA